MIFLPSAELGTIGILNWKNLHPTLWGCQMKLRLITAYFYFRFCSRQSQKFFVLRHGGLIDLRPLCWSVRKSLGKETLRGLLAHPLPWWWWKWNPGSRAKLGQKVPSLLINCRSTEEATAVRGASSPQRRWPHRHGGPSALVTAICLCGKRFLLFLVLPQPLPLPRMHSTEELPLCSEWLWSAINRRKMNMTALVSGSV